MESINRVKKDESHPQSDDACIRVMLDLIRNTKYQTFNETPLDDAAKVAKIREILEKKMKKGREKKNEKPEQTDRDHPKGKGREAYTRFKNLKVVEQREICRDIVRNHKLLEYDFLKEDISAFIRENINSPHVQNCIFDYNSSSRADDGNEGLEDS